MHKKQNKQKFNWKFLNLRVLTEIVYLTFLWLTAGKRVPVLRISVIA